MNSNKKKWKPVSGLEGVFEISNYGDCRSLNRIDRLGRPIAGMLKKPSSHGMYLAYSMKHNGVVHRRYVHVMVAEAFIGKKTEGMDIDHIDGNRKNNHVSNLRYLTHRENVQRSKVSNTGIKNISCQRQRGGGVFYTVFFFHDGKNKYLGGSVDIDKAKNILRNFKLSHNIKE